MIKTPESDQESLRESTTKKIQAHLMAGLINKKLVHDMTVIGGGAGLMFGTLAVVQSPARVPVLKTLVASTLAGGISVGGATALLNSTARLFKSKYYSYQLKKLHSHEAQESVNTPKSMK